MIGVDWIAGLPMTEGGFDSDMIQKHFDLLSGKAHALPTRSTATAAEAAEIIRDMCLRSAPRRRGSPAAEPPARRRPLPRRRRRRPLR